ncbi:hypothetical protein Drose_24900 [Dactylosporangium roseum]|uniref:DUF8175 domain-containing protein n=1 Tax=Dactylosporangium roseum TaxID=47989 RepID=A0ABY5Z067_9ACTN|nr:CCDC12/cwf18 family protein [Dactylosporangium roseum]UWZ34455.1 hypothetical protein Drose_24900 [Dactylosporangium roseum]
MWRGVEQPDYAGPRQPWTRPGFVAAAAFMVVVVLSGIGVALSAGGDSGASATGAPSVDAASPPDEEESSLPTDIPTAPPDDVSWQLFGQVAVPVSATDGPRRITETTASGYAHTPTGALTAAAQLMTRAGYYNGRRVWEPTITEQFVPSADRDQLLAKLRALPEEPTDPGRPAQLTGFRFRSYRPETAVIDLLLQVPNGTDSSQLATATVWWRDGDWRMVAPPDGSWTSLVRPVTDLTDFIPWGAQ